MTIRSGDHYEGVVGGRTHGHPTAIMRGYIDLTALPGWFAWTYGPVLFARDMARMDLRSCDAGSTPAAGATHMNDTHDTRHSSPTHSTWPDHGCMTMNYRTIPTEELEQRQTAYRALRDDARERINLPGDESTVEARKRLHRRFVRELDAVSRELSRRRKAAGQTAMDLPTNVHTIKTRRAA